MHTTSVRAWTHRAFNSHALQGCVVVAMVMVAVVGCDGSSSSGGHGGSGAGGATKDTGSTSGSGSGGHAGRSGTGGTSATGGTRAPDTLAAPDAGAPTADGAVAGRDSNLAPDLGRTPDSRIPGVPDVLASDTRLGPDTRPISDTGSNPSDTKLVPDAGTGKDTGGEGGNSSDPCAGGTSYADSTTAKISVQDYGWVRLLLPTSNQIVEFTTTMVVPETPPASGTLFLWPGMQPLRGAANFSALDNGVLQPVLTWGPTCAPNSPAQKYKSWWISGEYVNTNIASSSPNYAAYHDCHGGPGMNVSVGDTLDMRFALDGTDWTQTVTNRRNGQSVSFTIDMLGQAQGSAEWVIEEVEAKPVSDVIFTSSVITFASPAKSSCLPAQRGASDYFTAPRVSADGLRCCIDKITLRSQGVAATTPNSP